MGHLYIHILCAFVHTSAARNSNKYVHNVKRVATPVTLHDNKGENLYLAPDHHFLRDLRLCILGRAAHRVVIPIQPDNDVIIYFVSTHVDARPASSCAACRVWRCYLWEPHTKRTLIQHRSYYIRIHNRITIKSVAAAWKSRAAVFLGKSLVRARRKLRSVSAGVEQQRCVYVVCDSIYLVCVGEFSFSMSRLANVSILAHTHTQVTTFTQPLNFPRHLKPFRMLLSPHVYINIELTFSSRTFGGFAVTAMLNHVVKVACVCLCGITSDDSLVG